MVRGRSAPIEVTSQRDPLPAQAPLGANRDRGTRRPAISPALRFPHRLAATPRDQAGWKGKREGARRRPVPPRAPGPPRPRRVRPWLPVARWREVGHLPRADEELAWGEP